MGSEQGRGAQGGEPGPDLPTPSHTHKHTRHVHTHCALHGRLTGSSPGSLVGSRGRPPPLHLHPSPSSLLHSTDLHFPGRLLCRSLVLLQGLDALPALEDKRGMARGPDNMPQWATLVVLATMGTAVTAATNPGFLTRISQKGLDYGNWMPSLPPLPPLRSPSRVLPGPHLSAG